MSLREVGPGKTYSTIQAALDNLFIVVGAVAFTETHTIRVFTDTYLETATPNTLLNPTATFRLVIEGAAGNIPIIDGQTARANGIYVYIISYVTISGMTAKNHTANGIQFYSSSYCTAFSNTCFSNTTSGILFTIASSNCTAYLNTCYSGTSGIYFYQNCLNGTAYDNKCYSNTNGIQYYGSSANGICYRNNLYLNGTAITIAGSTNATIYRNNIYSNSTGIAFSSVTSIKIYNNLIYNNSIGLHGTTATNAIMDNNTLYRNASTGIYLNTVATNATVKNNIIWQQSGTAINVSDNSQAGFVSNRNNLYVVYPGVFGYWGSSRTTLAAWQAASGQDANSISAQPKFQYLKDGIAVSLKITDQSPCIGLGEDLSALFTEDYDGAIRTVPWDMGAYIFTAIYTPQITNQMLDNYAPTVDQTIVATCNVIGTPDHVVVKINNKAFSMSLVAGTQYRAIIPAYQIGKSAAQTVYFMATNAYDGSDEIAPSLITIFLNGNYDIKTIETAIVNLITTQCPALNTILGYEPKIIPQLPSATLWYDGFDQTQTEAVSYTINHRWILKVIVRLNDAQIAQDELKALIKSILSAFKSDLNLTRTVLKEVVPSGLVGTILDRNNPVLICNFNITTMTEED